MPDSPRSASFPGLAGLLLAAGGSSRFGTTKQLARFHGETLVARAAAALLQVCGSGAVVVVGSDASGVAGALARLDVRVVENPRWQSGQSTSLAAGAAAMPAGCDALLVLLCDQVLVDAADLALLAGRHAAHPDRAVAARHGSVVGAPAIFPRAHWPKLVGLRGDQGARAVLAGLAPLEVDLPHAVVDVDTPADLARLSGG